MGCDIHMSMEYKVNGEWRSADLYKKNEYYEEGVDDGEKEFVKVDVYQQRNYSLFACLCGVRDYSPGNIVLSDPKGIPSDCSNEYSGIVDDWDCDGHSHSWNTLSELLDYQEKNKTIKQSGLITRSQSIQLDKGIIPKIWCQGSTDKTLVHREWEEEFDVMGDLIDSVQKRCTDLYIYGKDPCDIRILYFFDN